MVIFKEKKFEPQFKYHIDKRLRAVILDLAWMMNDTFNKDLIITSLVRTPEENKAVGGLPKSAHLSGRAIDMRSKHLDDTQISIILYYVESVWEKRNVHIIHHKDHIHMNVNQCFSCPAGAGLIKESA